jgi:ribose transport system substrate-binding protein
MEDMNIVVSLKGPGGGNPFWASVEKGATEKGAELGVNVTVIAPPTESDVVAQISQIEDQLAKGVDAIAIAPADQDALVPVLEQAVSEGVAVLFIDTKANMDGVTFIGTDNLAGAELAAQYICDNVPEGSDVAILTGVESQTTAQHRRDGANAGLEGCGLNVVAQQTANWDRAEGQSVMENILSGNPNLTAVFASNDNMALGATETLKAAGVLDDIIMVGFDANPDAAGSVLAGEMSATVAQNPYNMGAFGVESAIKLIKGETLPEVVDTGTILVTADNADQYGELTPAAEQAEEMAMEDMNIVVSLKGPGGGNPFWASVEKGATEKGAELGVNVTVIAPPTESDVVAQITQIEDQLAKGVDAIAIAPADQDALVPVLEQAVSEGVAVLFIDTKANMDGVTFIGTDNLTGAELAAQYICDNVPEGSDVAILTGVESQTTAQHRRDGARAGLEGCGLNVVAQQTANWDRAEGQAVMENILTGNPNLTAVFASNDNMALGATEALKAAGVLDDIIMVGFDANPDAADSVLAGEMSATVAQNPYNMGAFGVESAIKLIKGESLPEVVDTGTILVTAEIAADYQ